MTIGELIKELQLIENKNLDYPINVAIVKRTKKTTFTAIGIKSIKLEYGCLTLTPIDDLTLTKESEEQALNRR